MFFWSIDMITRNRNKPIPSGYTVMRCTRCNTDFEPKPEKLTIADGGYLVECKHCGVFTKFNSKNEQIRILGVC